MEGANQSHEAIAPISTNVAGGCAIELLCVTTSSKWIKQDRQPCIARCGLCAAVHVPPLIPTNIKISLQLLPQGWEPGKEWSLRANNLNVLAK